jgi:hypothetical protein
MLSRLNPGTRHIRSLRIESIQKPDAKFPREGLILVQSP